MTGSLKRPLHGCVPLARRAFPARGVRFALDHLLSVDESLPRTFGPEVAPCLASAEISDTWCDHELTCYPDEDHSDDRYFPDVPVDLHVDVRASLRRGFDAIRELCRSANVIVLEDASSDFNLAWQNLNSITERNSAVAAKVDASKRVCVLE